jgi:hypothetical protein
MKLLRLVLSAAALSAVLAACDAPRLTAPPVGPRLDEAPPPVPSDTVKSRDQTMGSGS